MRNHAYIALGAVALVSLFSWNPASATYTYYVNGTTTPPATGPTPDEACLPMGSAVGLRWSYCDVASALFSFSQVDMALPGPMPIVLRRIYRSEALDKNGNAIASPFGNGMNFDYNMFLWSESEAAQQGLTNVDLILPNGGRVFCNCTGSSCVPPNNSFTCTATPSQTFYGATIQYVASPQSWVLTTKDQTAYSFSYAPSPGIGAILQSITDRYGNQVTINRQMPNLWQISSSNGRYILLTLTQINGTSVITQARDNAGRITSYGYTTQGHATNQTSMTSFTDLNGYITNFGWYTPQDIGSIKLKSVGGAGNQDEVTNVSYTALGSGYQFTLLTPPGNQGYYQIQYTMNGSQVGAAEITDPKLLKRNIQFNTPGYVISETLNDGGSPHETTTYTRDSASNFVTDKFDALNRHTHYTYDFSTTKVGNLLQVTRLYNSPNAFTTTFTYTPAFNQLQTITDPLGHQTQFQPFNPDLDGSIQKYIDPVNNTITFTYDPAGTGLVQTATDQAGDKTTFGYDTGGTGDLVSVQDPNGNTTTATYDGAGRLTSVTDPLRNTTTYVVDGIGHVTQITDAKGGFTKFKFDAAENPADGDRRQQSQRSQYRQPVRRQEPADQGLRRGRQLHDVHQRL